MSEHKCELCGTPVKVVGRTTKHYEPLGSMASVPSVAIDIALKAKKVMDLLEKHGSGIVQHLLDTDENAGQELRDAIHALLTKGKVKSQRQDSLADQMNTVIDLARKEGCYDAQDWIIKAWKDVQKG